MDHEPPVECKVAYSISRSWCLLALLLWLVAGARQLVTPSTVREADVAPRFVVELNGADAFELRALPEVGSSLAGRIVAARERQGRFNHLEELLDVPGIGTKTLERLRSMLVIDRSALSAERIQRADDQLGIPAHPAPITPE